MNSVIKLNALFTKLINIYTFSLYMYRKKSIISKGKCYSI